VVVRPGPSGRFEPIASFTTSEAASASTLRIEEMAQWSELNAMLRTTETEVSGPNLNPNPGPKAMTEKHLAVAIAC
jgi:hypothetical protein